MSSSAYVLVKSHSWDNLRIAVQQSYWCFPTRLTSSKQPPEILTELGSDVVIFISVNGSKGVSCIARLVQTEHCIIRLFDKDWYKYSIEVISSIYPTLDNVAIPFNLLSISKTTIDLNSARNFTVIPNLIGEEICLQFINQISKLVKQKEEEITARESVSGFDPVLSVTVRGNHNDHETAVIEDIKSYVETNYGRIIFSCPGGSRRYNLHTADSDYDIMIVYQAPSHTILGLSDFKTPEFAQSRHLDLIDYKVFELGKFCELLVKGDPKCVECLFLPQIVNNNNSTLLHDLLENKTRFLTTLLVTNYMKEIHGSKGLKKLTAIRQSSALGDGLKVQKLYYILFRLSQSCYDVLNNRGEQLTVFYPDDSDFRDFIMKLRGDVQPLSIQDNNDLYVLLLSKLSQLDILSKSYSNEDFTLSELVQNWLLDTRLSYMQLSPESN